MKNVTEGPIYIFVYNLMLAHKIPEDDPIKQIQCTLPSTYLVVLETDTKVMRLGPYWQHFHQKNWYNDLLKCRT